MAEGAADAAGAQAEEAGNARTVLVKDSTRDSAFGFWGAQIHTVPTREGSDVVKEAACEPGDWSSKRQFWKRHEEDGLRVWEARWDMLQEKRVILERKLVSLQSALAKAEQAGEKITALRTKGELVAAQRQLDALEAEEREVKTAAAALKVKLGSSREGSPTIKPQWGASQQPLSPPAEAFTSDEPPASPIELLAEELPPHSLPKTLQVTAPDVKPQPSSTGPSVWLVVAGVAVAALGAAGASILARRGGR
eukprot:GGOE01000694.1.p1 GENE.GGOE01000694.1~~GGOE01000694.1.p1  ORF type:complete len:251 (-),score=72.84 GGOE01000694.1:607-1359(-)